MKSLLSKSTLLATVVALSGLAVDTASAGHVYGHTGHVHELMASVTSVIHTMEREVIARLRYQNPEL